MLARDEIITAIDVGTTKVSTIIGRNIGRGGLQIIGHSTVPNTGLRKGNVADITLTEKAIRASIQKIESNTDYKIESAFVGITGTHVGFENHRNPMVSTSDAGVVTSPDMNRIPEAVGVAAKDPSRTLIQAINTSYKLDGGESVRNPLGMHSSQVEIETHVVTGGTKFIERLIQSVKQAKVKVQGLVLEPLASGMAVLTTDERLLGSVVVDIGGGTTDVVCFKDGSVCYTGVIPIGGYHFTNDIAITYDTTYDVAENLKLRYATTEHYNVDPSEEITLPSTDDEGDYLIKRYELCQLARERAQELAQMIRLKLNEADMSDPSRLCLVLTGGASKLEGLAKLLQHSIGMRVREGLPNIQDATIPHELHNPAYATSVGILLWASKDQNSSATLKDSRFNQGINVNNDAHAKGGILPRILTHASNLMGPFTRSENRKRRF